MSRFPLLALLAAVAVGGATTISCVNQNDSPATPAVESDEAAGYVGLPVSAESLDAIRKAELDRRAIRPVGDPKREWALNYDGVLKGREEADKRPKPAEAMPATVCRSVEPVTKGTDRLSGPHGVHFYTVHQFENESGFGLFRMFYTENRRGVSVARKAVDRVELVSLLTDLQPSVYVLDEMATPPLTRQAKRRPLDEFERRGLEAVRKGEELVWSPEAPKRMFGAIRASKSCLDCHSNAKEGDLLGAFTYYLDVPVDQIDHR